MPCRGLYVEADRQRTRFPGKVCTEDIGAEPAAAEERFSGEAKGSARRRGPRSSKQEGDAVGRPHPVAMNNPYVLLSWTLAGVLAVSLYPVLSCRRYLSKTTLIGAWWWALVAVVAWMLLAAVRPSLATTRWLSHVHYLASVLALCPFVAVLGARLPGARVWNRSEEHTSELQSH